MEYHNWKFGCKSGNQNCAKSCITLWSDFSFDVQKLQRKCAFYRKHTNEWLPSFLLFSIFFFFLKKRHRGRNLNLCINEIDVVIQSRGAQFYKTLKTTFTTNFTNMASQHNHTQMSQKPGHQVRRGATKYEAAAETRTWGGINTLISYALHLTC